MIAIYCNNKCKSGKILCNDCYDLLLYAENKLEKCPIKSDKPSCNKCKIHCYNTIYRDKIRNVMRFSGPYMIFKHPILTLVHIFKQ